MFSAYSLAVPSATGSKQKSGIVFCIHGRISADFWLHSRCCGATLEGEEEANRLAHRPDPSPDVPLPAEALAELRQRYGMLSRSGLQQVYADALERCKLDNQGRPPRADQIQVLVTAWRVLRKAR